MRKIPRVVFGSVAAVWAVLFLSAAAFAQCQHKFAEDVREPGCVTPGMRVEYCTICGAMGNSVNIDPLGHDYDDGVLTKEPTTTTMGRITYTCRRCGDSYEETTPKWHDPFDDVMPRHYFYTSVLWAYNNGITSGVAPNRFGPNADCTRGQVVMFLWRAMGSPEPASEENPFADVRSSDYFARAVLWAYHAGVTAGVDAAHFAPGQTCTRAQVVTFLYSAKGRPGYEGKVHFADVKPSAYYYAPVLWAAERGITAGVGNGRFGPEDRCVRGQIVTFLYQARGV